MFRAPAVSGAFISSTASVPSVASVLSLRRAAQAALAVAVFATTAVSTAPQVAAQSKDKTIYVSALDPTKKPIAGLGADTWAVKEDGKDCPVVSSKPATDPLDVVLMIDTSVNAQPTITELREGLAALAKTLYAGPAPVTMSIMDVAAADVMVAENKKNVDDALKVLEKTFGDRSGNTVMLEGLIDAAKKLGKSPSPRRAIVMVNIDGVPDASRSSLQDVVKPLLAANASVWAVTYQNTASKSIQQNGGNSGDAGTTGGIIGSGAVGQNLNYVLTKVPEGTGGMRDQIAVANGLTGSLTTIANALVGQYALTYTRTSSGPPPQMLELGQSKPGAQILYATAPVK